MKSVFRIAACAGLLTACSRPGPADTVDSLVADPPRLKQLRAACKADHAGVGDLLCNRVAEATSRVFLGKGAPCTPTRPGEVIDTRKE